MKRYFFLFVTVLLLNTCKKDDFETPNYNQKIVVDGWIEQGKPARVFLTLSTPFFSDVDSATLRKLVLTRAKVTVIDGTREEVLTLTTNFDYFPPYVYESTSLTGKIGHTYKLKVEYNGKTVTSTTQIPEPQLLQNISFKRASEIDTAGYIMIKFTDKPGVDNYYRVMTHTGNKNDKFVPVFLPNLDGTLVDGQSITLSILGEKDRDPLYFNENDTVFLKLCTIDQSVFTFWNSIYNELINTQNPFAATNSHVISNVDGGLGVWAGYGVSTYRIICK